MNEGETETAIRLPGWGADPHQALGRGAVLGRYFILDRLGSGGMGVVYAAYDPELDRKVAVKLLHARRAELGGRLLREAQAMARLSHPNVLAVHDVGTFGGTFADQVFVAMELVDGADLRQWLAASPRSRREVLDVFLKAGRGLAAAHAAGLVHLDFKPANVLVGNDGRVRVADFGLAQAEGGRGGAGTPAYMAPEQLAGGPVDARADQFSFCVSLYEALYGKRPFALGSFEVEAPPSSSKVPVRLRRLLLRGLAADPEDRFASMDDLLAVLESDPRPRHRRWALTLGAVAVGSALLGLGWVWRERAQICGGAEGRLASVWDPARKEAVRKAFLTTGAPFAESAFRGVERAVDGYVRGWAAMRTDACEATRRRGEQSEEVLDLRMACLDRSLESVDALAGLFTRADRAVVEKAVEAASGLPSLGDCADVPSLRARVKPPRDPAVLRRIATAQHQLAELNALADAGRYKEGLPRAVTLEAEVRKLEYAPLRAEALYRLGQLQGRAGDPKTAEQTLFEALAASEAGRDGPRAVDVGTELVWVVGDSLARPEEAQRWASLTQAKLRGMGGGTEKEGWLLNALGSILMSQRRFAESEAVLKTARDRLATALGPDSSAVIKVEFNLVNILLHTGRSEEALRRYPKVLEKLARSLGPDHPTVATGWNNLSVTYQALGRLAEAEAACRRALAVRTRALGPEHPETADNLLNLGVLRFLQGKPAEALSIFQRVHAIHEKVLGTDNPHLEYSLMNIAQSLETLGRYEEALPPLDRVLAIRAARPDQPIPLAEGWFYKGQILWEMGRRESSLALVRRAREILVRQGEPGKALLAELDVWLATSRRPARASVGT